MRLGGGGGRGLGENVGGDGYMRSGGTACGTPCGGEQLSAIEVEDVDLLVLVRFVLTEFESVGERASAWRRRMAALSADGSGTGGTLVLGEGVNSAAGWRP